MVQVGTREPAAGRFTDADVSGLGVEASQAPLTRDGHGAAAEMVLCDAEAELRGDPLQACGVGGALHYSHVAT